MLPDWLSNPESLAPESEALPTALCGPAFRRHINSILKGHMINRNYNRGHFITNL